MVHKIDGSEVVCEYICLYLFYVPTEFDSLQQGSDRFAMNCVYIKKYYSWLQLFKICEMYLIAFESAGGLVVVTYSNPSVQWIGKYQHCFFDIFLVAV